MEPEALFIALDDATRDGLAVGTEVLTGFAGRKLTGLLQRVTAVAGGDYLEVGVFQGSSLLHVALANPEVTCFGIDNYSQFDPNNRNRSLVVSRAETLGLSNYRLIDEDFEEGLLGFEGEVGTYFVDGPHDYRSQLVCLGYAPRFLKRGGVIIVDDANYPHVRQATADFLVMFPEFKLVFEAYTGKHPFNMTAQEEAEARDGWWDGVHVIVHDPDDRFEGFMPPVPGNPRFIRDHVVQIGRYGPVAWEASDLVQSLARPWQFPKALARFLRARKERADELAHRYRGCNTEGVESGTRLVHQKVASSATLR